MTTATGAHPFLKHRGDDLDLLRRVEAAGAVVDVLAGPRGPLAVGAGEPGALGALVVRVRHEVPLVRAVLTRGTGDAVPAAVDGLGPAGAWDWWWTCTAPSSAHVPPPAPAVLRLGVTPDVDTAAAIRATLEAANPSSSHRPGDPRTAWYGVRAEDGTIASVAAAVERLDGRVVRVGAVATRPEHRGAGLAGAVVAQVCTDAVARGAVVTLGTWSHNARVHPLYRRLGFEVGHSVENWDRSAAVA